MSDSLGMLFFKEKQIKMITALSREREWHITELAKEAEVTYVHTSRFISRCEASGIVTSEKHGRIKRIMLTEKGKEIAKQLASVVEKMEPKAAKSEQKPAQQPEKQAVPQKT